MCFLYAKHCFESFALEQILLLSPFQEEETEASAEKQEAQPSREDEGGCFRQREPPGERLGMFVTTAFQMSSFRESLGGICF